MILKEAIDKFLIYCEEKGLDSKTIKAYRLDLKQFLQFAQENSIEEICDITPDFIMRINTVWQENLKNRTAYRKNASLKVFMSYLWEYGYTEKKLYESVNIKLKREKLDAPLVVAVNDIQKLLKILEEKWNDAEDEQESKIYLRNLVIIEMFIYSGLRVSEICNLNFSDIILTEESYIIQIKGNRKRNVCVSNKKAAEHFKLYSRLYRFELYNETALFFNYRGKPISEQAVRRIVKKFAEPLNFNLTPKILRNTLALNIAKRTQNPRELQFILGDRSFSSTERHLERKESLPMYVIATENIYR